MTNVFSVLLGCRYNRAVSWSVETPHVGHRIMEKREVIHLLPHANNWNGFTNRKQQLCFMKIQIKKLSFELLTRFLSK